VRILVSQRDMDASAHMWQALSIPSCCPLCSAVFSACFRRGHFAVFRNGVRAEVNLLGSAARGQPMHIETLYASRRSIQTLFVATALLLSLAASSRLSATTRPTPEKNTPRAQLSIGYSLLYQEADGIPKLKWVLMFKEKPEEIGRITNELVSYYQQLAETMRRLSKQYPAMRIDGVAMSEIEADERKAIGADLAKDFAPLTGKTGVEFEREALLMFYDTLNEQRHLTGVMIGLETEPALRKFLDTTKAQLEVRYAKVGALLNRRYFTH
jgi:hypothetical protein